MASLGAGIATESAPTLRSGQPPGSHAELTLDRSELAVVFSSERCDLCVLVFNLFGERLVESLIRCEGHAVCFEGGDGYVVITSSESGAENLCHGKMHHQSQPRAVR